MDCRKQRSVIGSFLRFPAVLMLMAILLIGSIPVYPSGAARAAGVQEEPYLVKDIAPGNQSSYPDWLRDVNGTLFFTVEGNNYVQQLWKSDGSEAGTTLVKDICPGGSDCGVLAPMIVFKNQLFFAGDDGGSGRELWKSDGTPAGTLRVKDIYPGSESSNPGWFSVVGDTLFFAATDSRGTELWKSDGTGAGTVLVEDISPASSDPSGLTNINGTLYFSANDGSYGSELWKSDGTPAGTTMVKDIKPQFGSSDPMGFTYFHNAIYFFATEDSWQGPTLWKTNGTTAGTVMVKDLLPGLGRPYGPGLFHIYHDMLIFYVYLDEEYEDDQLWRSDGTEAGTLMVKDIRPGGDAWIDEFTIVADSLLFAADDGVNGRELWKTDGTAAGTVMVKNINPSTTNETGSSPYGLIKVNDTLYFFAYEPVHGYELWKSDGSETGTVLVADINPDGDAVPYDPPALVGNTLYMTLTVGNLGTELWAMQFEGPGSKIYLPTIFK